MSSSDDTTRRRYAGGNRAPVSARRALLALAPLALTLVATTFAVGCAPRSEEASVDDVNARNVTHRIAEETVRLALALGRHDADYVDAYLGPEAWRAEADQTAWSLEQIRDRTDHLIAELATVIPPAGDELAAARQRSLLRTLESLHARSRIVSGERLPFDEEARQLYDVSPPKKDASEFDAALAKLDRLLPGTGSLADRLSAFKADFVIPPDKLDEVFQAAIEACRERTRNHIDLPEDESFVLEYVTDKAWSGYNWYKGGYHSLIQINTDLPIYIDRALDLAGHEGYPGHHVYNVLVERDLVQGRGFQEYLIYPLFSPRSLIAEGSANFGLDVVFPHADRLQFEREVLFPLAGLDPQRVENYYAVDEILSELSYAGNEAARGYLDGTMDAEAAIGWMMTYSLSSRARAEQRLRFFEKYRSYVINYNLGQDLVRDFIESAGGTAEQPDERWRLFADLLSRPVLPSELTGG